MAIPINITVNVWKVTCMVGAPFGFVVEVEVESSEPEPEIGIYVVVCFMIRL